METLVVLFGGLAARLLLFVLLFTLFAAPIAAVVFLSQTALALHRRVAGTVEAGGAHWKPGLLYTDAHAWVKTLWRGRVKVGLDDVARRILSGVSSFTLPAVGTRLRRGDPMATMRCGERLVVVPSPVAGVVLERNRKLMCHPTLFEHEPYGEGWMVRIETQEAGDVDAYRGSASRTWLRQESLRLNRFLEPRLGMAAADGGTLTSPPSALLSDDDWHEASRLFLQQ